MVTPEIRRPAMPLALTAAQVAQVRGSFARLQRHGAAVADGLYQRLFRHDPSLRRLFGGDLAVQGQRLMAMIGAAVALLDQPQRLESALRELGERHVGYGVTAGHYASVGAALIETLAAALGDGFDAPTRDAWAAMYAQVAAAMQAGVAAAA